MNEIWKDIPGYETLYQASNLGNIKSIKREHYIPSLNKIIYVNNNKILKSAISKHGYKIVVLTRNKKRKTYKVHRLIAMTFIPNPNNLPQVNHIDGNKQNKQLYLEVCKWRLSAKKQSVFFAR